MSVENTKMTSNMKFNNLNIGTHTHNFVHEDKNYDVVINVGKPSTRIKHGPDNKITLKKSKLPFFIDINVDGKKSYSFRIPPDHMSYIFKMSETSDIEKLIPSFIDFYEDCKKEKENISKIINFMKQNFKLNDNYTFVSFMERETKDNKTYHMFGSFNADVNVGSRLEYLLIKFGILPIFFKEKENYSAMSFRYIINIDTTNIDSTLLPSEDDIKILNTVM